MPEINLLKALPISKRNVQARSVGKNPDVIRVSKQYGKMYFDGPREYGYGGYYYDGRWLPVANDIIQYFHLKPGQRVLDVGCAKGFLVKDIMTACPGIEAFGIDISEYALTHCEPDVIGRLHLGSADNLPFGDQSFDLVMSINTIHNLSYDRAIRALSEIQRISKGPCFVQVDSYYTPEQKALFEDWMLTAEYYDYPEQWLETFKKAGYKGDYFWTVLE